MIGYRWLAAKLHEVAPSCEAALQAEREIRGGASVVSLGRSETEAAIALMRSRRDGLLALDPHVPEVTTSSVDSASAEVVCLGIFGAEFDIQLLFAEQSRTWW